MTTHSAKIPFLSLGDQVQELRVEIDEAVSRVLSSGWYLLGPELEAFENEWARYCGAKYAVGVANGLDALHLSLRALGIGSGHEVIVPSNTYIATWLAVTQTGALPIPVEPDLVTYTIDPSRIEASITSRTKAIIPVHLYGHPCDMDPILEIANRHGLCVVEDAAQAHGARYRERIIGAHGDLIAWSFYPTKNLGAIGDAGAITTNNEQLAKDLRCLRNYGSQKRYVCDVIGYNSRMEEMHAAILRVKLRHLDSWNDRRRSIAGVYMESLSRINLTMPIQAEWAHHVFHLFVVRTKHRDNILANLDLHGIGAIAHYPVPPHFQNAYRFLADTFPALPISELIHREVMSLPCSPTLRHEELQRVVECLQSIELAD